MTERKELKNIQAVSFEFFGWFPHYSDHFKQRGEALTIKGNKPAAIKAALKEKKEDHALAVLVGVDGVKRFAYFRLFYDSLMIKPLQYSGLKADAGGVLETWRVSDADKARKEAETIVLYFGDFFKSEGHQTAEKIARMGERFKEDGRAASGYNIKYGYKLDRHYWDTDASGYVLQFYRMELKRRLSQLKAARQAAAIQRAKELKELELKRDDEAAQALRLALFDRIY